jgi:hypothetical protein
MNGLFSEKIKVDVAHVGANSSVAISRYFSMNGYDKAAIIVGEGTGLSTVAQPYRIHVVPVESDTVAVTTASSPLAGSSITMGTTAVGRLSGVQGFSIRIHATAALATIPTVVVNSRTLTGSSVASGTALTFLGSTTVVDGKAMGLSLATLIRDRCTELETTWSTVMATAAEGVNIHCHVKDYGAAFGNAKATVVTTYASSAMTSTNCIMAYARYAAGMIDFDVADLKSTNSSAQGFRVVCEATAASGSAMPISAMVLREPSAYVPVDKGFKSQSTLHSS